MMEGLRVCVCTVALALLVCVSLLTRALYWFMIMTGGLCLCLWQPVVRARCSLTKLCHMLLIRPLSLPPSLRPPCASSMSLENQLDIPQRTWKLRGSAVGCSQVCQWCRPAYLSFHVGIWSGFSFLTPPKWRQGEGFVFLYWTGVFFFLILGYFCRHNVSSFRLVERKHPKLN